MSWPECDAEVRERFSKLLQETSIGVSCKANMWAMKQAFKKSVTMQSANFMPGEWLPSEDKG